MKRLILLLCYITIAHSYMHATANRNSILQNNCISYSKRYSNSYSNSRSANFYGKNCGNSYGNSVGYGYSNRCNQLFGTSSSSTTKVIVTKATTPSTANSFVKIWNRVVSRLSIVFLSGASPVIAGGFLSGGLHAITVFGTITNCWVGLGPDHLAAILPPSVGQPGYYGLQVGAIWGIGHGISAMILGLCAFALKGKLTGRFSFIERLTVLAESAVGISLLAIGILGIRENIQGGDVHAEYSSSDNDDGGIGGAKAKTVPKRAIFANGILHGFSLDGAPSIAPAIAFSSWNNAITFLLAYCIGTMGTMSLAAAILGETSMRIGKAANDPELPRRLSMISSGIAILIGLFWIAKTTILK